MAEDLSKYEDEWDVTYHTGRNNGEWKYADTARKRDLEDTRSLKHAAAMNFQTCVQNSRVKSAAEANHGTPLFNSTVNAAPTGASVLSVIANLAILSIRAQS